MVLDDRNINLVEAGIDVALRMGPLSDSGLTARRIGECRRVVLATPDYFARHGEPACPADLGQHQAIIYSLGGGAHWRFERGDEQQSVTVRGRIRVSAAEGLREAVLAHQGLTLASQWMFAPELASGAVREAMPDWTLPRQELWAVFPTGRLTSAKARAFVEFVQQQLASPGPDAQG
ncbi:hypothetical protein TRE132_17470 [Pseudomonas chlororaphis subsp. aurantiaca]|nr:hypothetical protein TRE132_17470 [Pseudomonas chlororaphis subsp. aurantiaca]